MARTKKGKGDNLVLKGTMWWVEISIKGERHRESTGMTRRADALRIAKDKIRRWKAEAAARQAAGPDADTDFDDAVLVYWNNVKDTVRNPQPLKTLLRRCVVYVGPDTMCSSLDYAFLCDLRATLLNEPAARTDNGAVKGRPRSGVGLKPKSVNQILAKVMRVVRLTGRLLNMEFPDLPNREFGGLLLTTHGRGRYMKDLEETLLKQACDPDLRDIVEFDLETGLRASELIGLKWDDIDVIEESLTVPVKAHGHDPYMHTVFLSEKALEILDRRRGLAQSEYVFNYETRQTHWNDGILVKAGERIAWSYNQLRIAFAAAVVEAKLKDLSLHDLRRTCARRIWWVNGVEVAAAFLGHRDTKTTLRYLALTEHDTKAAILHRERLMLRRREEIAAAIASGDKAALAGFDDKRLTRIRAELIRLGRLKADDLPSASESVSPQTVSPEVVSLQSRRNRR